MTRVTLLVSCFWRSTSLLVREDIVGEVVCDADVARLVEQGECRITTGPG